MQRDEIEKYERSADLTLTEFLEQFRREKEIAEEIRQNAAIGIRPDREDERLLEDVEKKQEYVNTLAKAQNFAINSTSIYIGGKSEMEMGVCTHFSAENYKETYSALTNGYDAKTIYDVQTLRSDVDAEKPLSDFLSSKDKTRADEIESLVVMTAYTKAIEHAAQDYHKDLPAYEEPAHDVTIRQTVPAIRAAQKTAESFGFDMKSDDFNDKISNGFEDSKKTLLPSAPYLGMVEDYQKEEKEAAVKAMKEAEPVVVVESNDGYVMNMSERTADNAKQIDELVRDNGSGKEVVHEEAPRETTTDRSKVGGNVKYETVKEEGTKDVAAREVREEQEEKAEESEAKTDKALFDMDR